MANIYPATALTGGGTGALDAIDGDLLANGDKAFALANDNLYVYHLNDSSAAAESSPNIISPDTNAYAKRWILQTLFTPGGRIGGRENQALNSYDVVCGGGWNLCNGYSSFIGSGQNNEVTDAYSSVVGGRTNKTQGEKSFIGGGDSNIVSGDYSSIPCGNSCRAAGHYSLAAGAYSSAYLDGQFAFSHTMFANRGDAQRSYLVMAGFTTNATQTELMTGSIYGATRAILPASRAWSFEITLVARQYAGTGGTIGDSFSRKYTGLIKRDAANNTAVVGSITDAAIAADAGAAAWAVTVDADDTNESLRIRATGEADKSIRWVAYVNLVEVG